MINSPNTYQTHTRLALMFFAVASVGYAQSASPKTSGSTDGRTVRLQEFEVTEPRTSAQSMAPTDSRLEATQPESIINLQTIQNSIAPTADYAMIAALSPSVTNFSTNGPGLNESKPTLRGFNDGNYNVTIDGIPFGDGNDFNHHTTSYFPAKLLGRVTVDRGPGTASTIGMATFGGTIAMETKDPRTEASFVPTLSYGSWKTQLAHFEANTGVMPKAQGGSLIASYQYMDSAGYKNYFNSRDAAARYAGSRPQSHGRVLEKLRRSLGAELPVARALDVGCGTGHSTVALVPIAKSIVGLDSSPFMLAQAPRHPAVEYRSGYAEALPFAVSEFDLITVCSAYHWFDQERFLQESARVLRGGGWLVLYKVGSTGKITGCPSFDEWKRETFRARYPKAVRNDEHLTAEKAAAFGFSEVACERHNHVVGHSIDEYVDNLLTHSSLIRAIDQQKESASAARAWLRGELAPFFPGGEAKFTHSDWIHVLRRNAGE